MSVLRTVLFRLTLALAVVTPGAVVLGCAGVPVEAIIRVLALAVAVQDQDAHDNEHLDECIKVYNTAFRTDRGEIVLEYRNSSNGYYGGYLVDTHNP